MNIEAAANKIDNKIDRYIQANGKEELKSILKEFAESIWNEGEKAQMLYILKLEAIIKDYEDIRNDSEGLTGWHRNGDVAEWDEFGFEDLDSIEYFPAVNPYKNQTSKENQ